jgi:hypothetical protein
MTLFILLVALGIGYMVYTNSKSGSMKIVWASGAALLSILVIPLVLDQTGLSGIVSNLFTRDTAATESAAQ